jgi:hypothetical protein
MSRGSRKIQVWDHHDAEWQVCALGHSRSRTYDAEYSPFGELLNMLKHLCRDAGMMESDPVFQGRCQRVVCAEKRSDLLNNVAQKARVLFVKVIAPFRSCFRVRRRQFARNILSARS